MALSAVINTVTSLFFNQPHKRPVLENFLVRLIGHAEVQLRTDTDEHEKCFRIKPPISLPSGPKILFFSAPWWSRLMFSGGDVGI